MAPGIVYAVYAVYAGEAQGRKQWRPPFEVDTSFSAPAAIAADIIMLGGDFALCELVRKGAGGGSDRGCARVGACTTGVVRPGGSGGFWRGSAMQVCGNIAVTGNTGSCSKVCVMSN